MGLNMDRLQSMGVVSAPRDLPAPSFSTSTIGPIIGVVDGSDAAPGEVGEFIKGGGSFNYSAGAAGGVTSQGQIAALNLPPGDWDCAVSASFTTLIDSAFFLLNPQPVGLSNKMFGLMGLFGGGTGGGASPPADLETVILIGQTARASVAVTTLLSFEVQVYQGTAVDPAGTMDLDVECRRRR